jgi:hypothetical protein
VLALGEQELYAKATMQRIGVLGIGSGNIIALDFQFGVRSDIQTTDTQIDGLSIDRETPACTFDAATHKLALRWGINRMTDSDPRNRAIHDA